MAKDKLTLGEKLMIIVIAGIAFCVIGFGLLFSWLMVSL
jgi:hypothetical protein